MSAAAAALQKPPRPLDPGLAAALDREKTRRGARATARLQKDSHYSGKSQRSGALPGWVPTSDNGLLRGLPRLHPPLPLARCAKRGATLVVARTLFSNHRHALCAIPGIAERRVNATRPSLDIDFDHGPV